MPNPNYFRSKEGIDVSKIDVLFNDKTMQDQSYKSVFGPGFHHTGVIYGKSDVNTAFGMRRFVSYRGDSGEKHNELENNQRQFLVVEEFKQLVKNYFSEMVFKWELDDFLSLETYCALPHSKRLLRERCLMEWIERGDFGGSLGAKSVLLKMKLSELAKYNGWPRMIFDLGVGASLKGAMITEVIKNYMFSKPLLIDGLLVSFVKKPSRSLLRDAFGNLIEPKQHRGYFYYFSDDSSLAIRKSDGRVMRGNLDIKQCDASHTSELFSAILDLLPTTFRPLLSILVKQLCLPIRLQRYKDKKVYTLFHDGPILMSGSTLTTFVNNFAQLLISFVIAKAPVDTPMKDMVTLIEKSGYLCSFEDCSNDYASLQFLKHSPVMCDNGQIEPVINFGVFVRCFGCCDGDLPGRGDIGFRAYMFNRGIVQCTYPYFRAPFIGILRAYYRLSDVYPSPPGKNDELIYKKSIDDEKTFFYASDEEYFKRYTLKDSTIFDFNHILSSLQENTVYRCELTDIALEKDYGFTSPS